MSEAVTLMLMMTIPALLYFALKKRMKKEDNRFLSFFTYSRKIVVSVERLSLGYSKVWVAKKYNDKCTLEEVL